MYIGEYSIPTAALYYINYRFMDAGILWKKGNDSGEIESRTCSLYLPADERESALCCAPSPVSFKILLLYTPSLFSFQRKRRVKRDVVAIGNCPERQ